MDVVFAVVGEIIVNDVAYVLDVFRKEDIVGSGIQEKESRSMVEGVIHMINMNTKQGMTQALRQTGGTGHRCDHSEVQGMHLNLTINVEIQRIQAKGQEKLQPRIYRESWDAVESVTTSESETKPVTFR